jgi:hypothetical protein
VDVSAHAVGDVLRLASPEGELLIGEGWADLPPLIRHG